MSGLTSGTLYGATLELAEVIPPAPPYASAGVIAFSSVWYKWTPASTQTQIFDTSIALNDTVLAVYKGPSSSPTVGALTPVAFSDDIGRIYPSFDAFFTSSRVEFDAVATQTYYIQVINKTAAVTTFSLTWSKAPVITMTLVAGMTAHGYRNISSGAITAASHYAMADTFTGGASLAEMDSTYSMLVSATVNTGLLAADRLFFPINTYMTAFGDTAKSARVKMNAKFTLAAIKIDTGSGATAAVQMTAVFTFMTGSYIGIDAPSTDGSGSDFQFEAGIRLRLSTSAQGSIIRKFVGITVEPLKIISPTMAVPVIIQGRPMHPAQVIRASTKLHATGSASTKPSPGVLTLGTGKSASHAWIAQDFPFPEGVYGDHWPAHNGKGPTWHSAFPYRPRRQSFSGAVDYNNVVVFWWHYVEHMWAKFDIPQPFTFVITGILHGGSSDQDQHLLDGVTDSFTGSTFYNTPIGTYGVAHETRHQVYTRFKQTQIQQGAGTTYTGQAQLYQKAAVYTMCFNGSKSYVDVHMQGYHKTVRGNTGTGSAQYILLGRQAAHISPFWASHMSLLEIQLFSSVLSAAELTNLRDQLYAVYSLHKW